MLNAVNTKILIAILVLVAGIAATISWNAHERREAERQSLQRKMEREHEEFLRKADKYRKTEPSYVWSGK